MSSTTSVSVMIAQNETAALDTVTEIVSLCAPHIYVTGTSEDGLEMLQLLETQVPDILITDIEMPGLSGSDLIQYVSTWYPSVRIVILSNCSNFEYIRTAIRFKVKDYLLRPVSKKELSSALLSLSEEILQEKEESFRNILSLNLAGYHNPTLPSHCFPNERFLLLFLTLGNLPSKYVKPIHLQSPSSIWDRISPYDCFHEIPNILHIWSVTESYPFQKFIILSFQNTAVNFSSLSQTIYTSIAQQLEDLPFYLVTDNELIPYTRIQASATKLRLFTAQTLNMCKREVTVFSENALISKGILDPKLKNLLPHQFDSMSQLIKFTVNTLQYYIENDAPQRYIDDFLYEIYLTIPHSFSLDTAHCAETMNAVLSRLHSFITPEKLYKTVKESLTALYTKNSSELTPEFLCEKMQNYLEANYAKKINVEKLSKSFGYSSTYLSRIFKKKYGISPLQYRMVLRIDEAKKLLKRNIKTKNIALLLGFEDAHYFSRVFRQATGMSPSEWKTKNGRLP